uniref:Thioredoxin domain-containing protein n=1 Tax=Oncorhynchus mykiss TaxID=8022 RepID=A0A8K9VAZ4_ONCMY
TQWTLYDRPGFDKALEEAGDKLVVVDFTATWCGPCQSIAPFFKGLSENYQSVVFLKVDVDDAPDVASFCDIKCMPTFHFYKNQKKVGGVCWSLLVVLKRQFLI